MAVIDQLRCCEALALSCVAILENFTVPDQLPPLHAGEGAFSG